MQQCIGCFRSYVLGATGRSESMRTTTKTGKEDKDEDLKDMEDKDAKMNKMMRTRTSSKTRMKKTKIKTPKATVEISVKTVRTKKLNGPAESV